MGQRQPAEGACPRGTNVPTREGAFRGLRRPLFSLERRKCSFSKCARGPASYLKTHTHTSHNAQIPRGALESLLPSRMGPHRARGLKWQFGPELRSRNICTQSS